MQTIQNRKSRIWEMKEDNYTKSLAKIYQACAILNMPNIQVNVIRKFTKLYMETPSWYPLEGHKLGTISFRETLSYFRK